MLFTTLFMFNICTIADYVLIIGFHCELATVHVPVAEHKTSQVRGLYRALLLAPQWAYPGTCKGEMLSWCEFTVERTTPGKVGGICYWQQMKPRLMLNHYDHDPLATKSFAYYEGLRNQTHSWSLLIAMLPPSKTMQSMCPLLFLHVALRWVSMISYVFIYTVCEGSEQVYL